ncbi:MULTISPECIES: CRISPR-associated ring nuclease Csm6 [Rodentibacter]|uniref:CRISPR-associated ring nuclease Csm6 n=1 Tax=Rodentibacter TaxID=1960084 RepID=UPI001CFE2D19|nr:CRISPR-associated ring nuclease Csm6 [Rodentibacter sp. JRC1]GJI56762.1 hypothetical protein HEMROJRC1_18740 [Rodentibacter sp. JRC1]
MKKEIEYNKRILLSVTGMSPAVVTETLFALVTEKGFIPTEIKVITTLQGKNKLMKSLLGIEGGRKVGQGAIAEFVLDYGQQYGFTDIHFDESCIEVLKDKSGQFLVDIRTPEENTLASDQIVSLVGDLCKDEQSAVHISIAGGRKTMGFFLGYALSLYGREQDSLSHVLVSSKFEMLENFYYPKPRQYLITDRDGKELDASTAKVMLAEIPWVRLGLSGGVSEQLLKQKITYSQSVEQAQRLIEKPSITFLSPIDERKVKLGALDKPIKLAAKPYALLLTCAICKVYGYRYKYYELPFVRLYFEIYDYIKTGDTDKIKQELGLIEPLDQTIFQDIYPPSKNRFSESSNQLNKALQKYLFVDKHNPSIYSLPVIDTTYTLFVDEINLDKIQNNISHFLTFL